MGYYKTHQTIFDILDLLKNAFFWHNICTCQKKDVILHRQLINHNYENEYCNRFFRYLFKDDRR